MPLQFVPVLSLLLFSLHIACLYQLLGVIIIIIIIIIIILNVTLQEKIDTVTAEGVENVEEEERIEIKTEDDYIQLVRVIKTEQEVSVLCSK